MTMCGNGRWAAVAGERGGVAFVQVLRAAAIAAVASSCAMMQDQSDPDAGDAAMPESSEEYPAPEIKRPEQEERARFEDFLSKEGYQDVQFVTLAYTDPETGEEKLIALELAESEAADPDVPEDEFLIPPVGINFSQAIVTYIGSPARLTSCGRRSGGTRYCDFR